MKVLVTGAAGHLGRGIVVPFEEHGYALRLMDVTPMQSTHEVITGDVADLNSVRDAVGGVDAVVIAHMAPTRPNAYDTPTVPFDANVKGTANLFFAAAEAGIERVVLVSSTAAITGHDLDRYPHDLLPKTLTGEKGLYALTKGLQEVIAEHFHRQHGIRVAVLRPAYIIDADTMTDKAGRTIPHYMDHLVDRRDIGEAARLALECPDLGYEAFNLMGTVEALEKWDVRYTCERLGWKPKYDFQWLPGFKRTPRR